MPGTEDDVLRGFGFPGPRLSWRAAGPGILLTVVLLEGCGSPPAAGTARPADLGSDVAVQQWFTRHEPERLAVDQALHAAYQQLDGVPAAGRGCASLLSAADAMLAALPTPDPVLDPQVVAGIAEFRTGARQCLAGAAAAAKASLAAGAARRADAELALDDLLEAPDVEPNR